MSEVVEWDRIDLPETILPYKNEHRFDECMDHQLTEDTVTNNLSDIKLVPSSHDQVTHCYTVCNLHNLQLHNSINILYQYNQLITVDLSHNQLNDNHVTDIFSHLTHLSTLNLSHNNITHFCSSGHSVSLTSLDLSHNQLISLDELYKYTNLYTLDVSNNNIDTITNDVARLHRLHTLNISHNNLTSIQHICNSNLFELFVSHNDLTSFDVSQALPRLSVLNLSQNNITEFSSCIPSIIPCITSIDLTHNQLHQLTELYVLTECKYLSRLNVSNNPYHSTDTGTTDSIQNIRYHLMYNLRHLTTIDNIAVDGKQMFNSDMLYKVYDEQIHMTQKYYLPDSDNTTMQLYINNVKQQQIQQYQYECKYDIDEYWCVHLSDGTAHGSMKQYSMYDDIITMLQDTIIIDLSNQTIQPIVIWYICDLLINLYDSASTHNTVTPPIHINLSHCIINDPSNVNGRCIAMRYLLTVLRQVNTQSLNLDAMELDIQYYINELCELIQSVPALQTIHLSHNTIAQHNQVNNESCPALYKLLDAIQYTTVHNHSVCSYVNLSNNQLDQLCIQLLSSRLYLFNSIDISMNPQLTNQLSQLFYTLHTNTTITQLVCRSILSSTDWQHLSTMLTIHNCTILHIDVSNTPELFTDVNNCNLLRQLILHHHTSHRTSAFVLQSIDITNCSLSNELYDELTQLSDKQIHSIKLIH